jgi:hypothetical protein
MKKVLILLFLSLFCLCVNGQNTENSINEIYLAKDDGNGKAGDAVENFYTTDVPIFCVVKLNLSQPTEVKLNFVAVKVKGVKPETVVIATAYKTKDEQNRVNFKGKPEKIWITGTYRVDIFLDGKLARTQDFEIVKTPISESVANKPKPIRKFRRN